MTLSSQPATPERVQSRRAIGVGQAARMIGVSGTTVRRLIEDGTLAACRLRPGGKWRIKYDSVVDYVLRLERQSQGLEMID